MKIYNHLKFNPALLLKKPYSGDSDGSFVTGSKQIEIVLLKSENPNEILAEVYFLIESAGPPGHVHGGCQAAVLDEMMGSVGWQFGYKVVAAKIEVEFKDMIPIKKQYSVVARIKSVDKRKVFVEAEIYDTEKIYAKSSGLFICLTDEQMQSISLKLKSAPQVDTDFKK